LISAASEKNIPKWAIPGEIVQHSWPEGRAGEGQEHLEGGRKAMLSELQMSIASRKA